jgi:hypothetical protein
MFPLLLSKYHTKDIFNADMCGLLFSLLPDKKMLSKIKATGSRGVNIELLCLCVRIEMDVRRYR